uniref:Protein FAM186B n=1 Tax=Castor canadensis TaxID=51338 RepID=A0A8C0XXW0_CASCN
MENDNPTQLVTPASVKAIISRIEAAQLTRAQEDISTQLSDILGNVSSVINHFQEELGYDLKEKVKFHQTEQKGKKRFILLKKIASFSKDAKMKEKHLHEILCWLGDWGEYGMRRSEEEEEALDEWIQAMEKVLPLSLISTKGGIESLISLCCTLIEEQKKKAQRPIHTFWQDWLEKSPEKSTPHSQPLSPEQMLQDKNITCTKVSEVKSMLQELLDSTIFSKGQIKIIKYMSTVVENLNKALILQHKENRSLETKYRYLQTLMTKGLSSQRIHFQKSIKLLESKRDALLKQVEALGRKYHDLLLIKHALEFQLKQAQTARGQAEDLAEVPVDFPEFPEEGAFPKEGIVMGETQQEPKEEEHLFSLLSTAWDSGATPSTRPLSTMPLQSRIADVFSSKDTESLVPMLPLSEGYQSPTEWERQVAEGLGHEDQDQEDHFQEKEGVQIKFYINKVLSQQSSEKVPLENQLEQEHGEEELSWERRRQQWLQEEEMWLQRQKKWALLEQEHAEKLRQWEREEASRWQQQQRLTHLKEERQSPRKGPEEPRDNGERQIFTTTSQWRNLEKVEPLPVPPPSPSQSACLARKPCLPKTPRTLQPALGNQRAMSSVEFTQTLRAGQVPTKPKKSSFPITGTSIRRVTRPSIQKVPVAPKEKEYHIDMESQRKNLQLLKGELELGLPHTLRSKVLELITTTMELGTLRLQCLCQKYILYRHFQSLRLEVINHIQVMQEMGTTYKAQSLYIFLENIDRQQKLSLQAWTDKQKDVEVKRRECLSSMVAVFPKLQLEWNVHLNIPVVTFPKPRKNKSSPVFRPQHVRYSGSTCKQPFLSKHQKCVPLRMASQKGNQMEAVWKADVASSSHPIEKKTPASLLWDQVAGYPDIPWLLAVDEHSSYHRSLMPHKAQ